MCNITKVIILQLFYKEEKEINNGKLSQKKYEKMKIKRYYSKNDIKNHIKNHQHSAKFT